MIKCFMCKEPFVRLKGQTVEVCPSCMNEGGETLVEEFYDEEKETQAQDAYDEARNRSGEDGT